jgi:hypothetical protein
VLRGGGCTAVEAMTVAEPGLWGQWRGDVTLGGRLAPMVTTASMLGFGVWGNSSSTVVEETGVCVGGGGRWGGGEVEW